MKTTYTMKSLDYDQVRQFHPWNVFANGVLIAARQHYTAAYKFVGARIQPGDVYQEVNKDGKIRHRTIWEEKGGRVDGR